jgi:hypothetical protein
MTHAQTTWTLTAIGRVLDIVLKDALAPIIGETLTELNHSD